MYTRQTFVTQHQGVFPKLNYPPLYVTKLTAIEAVGSAAGSTAGSTTSKSIKGVFKKTASRENIKVTSGAKFTDQTLG